MVTRVVVTPWVVRDQVQVATAPEPWPRTGSPPAAVSAEQARTYGSFVDPVLDIADRRDEGRAAGPGGAQRPEGLIGLVALERRGPGRPGRARSARPRLRLMADDAAPVSCTITDGVAVLRLDDGKVNAVSHRVVELLHEGLDRALEEATAVALVGREGKLCAGFDLSEMTAGAEQARALVGAGGRLLMRIYGHPQPVVVAVTGHALAAGALLALACDTRIGAEGPSKIGLNETAIGMGLPAFAVELARARLSPAHLTRSAIQAEIYDPAGAVEAGYLDRVVPADECEAAAVAEAARLGQLPAGAHRHTKLALRQPLIDRVLAGMDDDLAGVGAPA
jgi:enoyl-CoA hydratase